VGIVCTASSLSFCNLYKIVVFPALSKPRIKIRTSFDPKRVSKTRLIIIPMVEIYVNGRKLSDGETAIFGRGRDRGIRKKNKE
jgi:hypothetical protein